MGMTNQKPMVLKREARRFNQEAGKVSRIGKAYRFRYITAEGKEMLDVVIGKGPQAKVKANLEAQLEVTGATLILFEKR